MKIKIPGKLFILGFILSASLLWPLAAAPYFKSQDDIQVIRVYEMTKCIRDLQIPCRWVPDLGAGYGYPLFNYYGPLPYYFGAIFHLLGFSLLMSVKIMFATSFLGSFIFMYMLGKKLWRELGGVVSGVFYSFAPYHAVDFYVRGAMGELWGLLFFPAVVWSILNLKEKLRIRDGLLVSLCIFGLITSHNLSALIFIPIGFTFTLILLLQKFNLRFLKILGLSAALGFLLSSFYLVPVIFEKNLVHLETTTIGYFSYTEHFEGFRRLLLDNRFGYGASVREIPGGEIDTLSYQIGWLHLLAFILALIFGSVLFKNVKEKTIVLTFFAASAVISTFMIHPLSLPIWKVIEPLKYLQFPWRLLGFVIFFVSLVAGSIFYFLETVNLSEKFKKSLFVFLLIGVVVLNFRYFKPESFINTTDEQLLSGDSLNYQITRSIFDFLPKSAKFPPAKVSDQNYEINPGEVQITKYEQGTNWINFNANVKSLSLIRLSQYYFPNFEVIANGKKIDINSRNELGLISFYLDPGKYNVQVRLKDTPIRVIGNALTLVGLIVFLVLVLMQFNKGRTWIMYYLKRIG